MKGPQFFINPFTAAIVPTPLPVAPAPVPATPTPLPVAPAPGPDFPWWYEQEDEDFD